MHLQCLLITFLSWYHLGTTVVPGWKQANWLGKGHSTNSGKGKRWHFKVSGILLPKNTSFPSARGSPLYLMLNYKQGITRKWLHKICISQSWNILTMALLYTLSLADPQILFSSSTVISSTGRTMCGKAMAPRWPLLGVRASCWIVKTILLVLVSAKTLHKQGGNLQSKVSNTHIFKQEIIDLCKDIWYGCCFSTFTWSVTPSGCRNATGSCLIPAGVQKEVIFQG